jgi:hypothetical protein
MIKIVMLNAGTLRKALTALNRTKSSITIHISHIFFWLGHSSFQRLTDWTAALGNSIVLMLHNDGTKIRANMLTCRQGYFTTVRGQ